MQKNFMPGDYPRARVIYNNEKQPLPLPLPEKGGVTKRGAKQDGESGGAFVKIWGAVEK